MKRKSKPVIVENVLVEDYAAEGKSLAHVNGKVIFIEHTVPGDVVNVQLQKNKKDWAEGFPVEFIQYAENRIEPFCEHFGICGGCQWQMLPYEQQLFYKQKQVADNLQRIGKISLPEMLPIIGCDETRFYRNKLEYTFSNKKYLTPQQLHNPLFSSSENVAGYHARNMFDKVIEINVCHLQPEPTNLIRKAVEHFGKENNLGFYDARLHTGWLRTMQIRSSNSGEWMVNIMIGFEDEKHTKLLMDKLIAEFPQITSLLYTINTKFNDSWYDLEPKLYFGNEYITETLEDFKFKISPKSFFQTNTRQSEKLYSVAKDFAELNSEQTLYDLYCGTGSIGIFLSKNAKKIIGVETVDEAVKDAYENARLNNINHAEFFSGDVVEICNENFFQQNGTPDVIITDPPRAGMHEKLIKKLLDIPAPLIVYVSCNPATQARDLNLLDEKYAVKKIQPVDMFPHTHHIENVVQLKLKN